MIIYEASFRVSRGLRRHELACCEEPRHDLSGDSTRAWEDDVTLITSDSFVR